MGFIEVELFRMCIVLGTLRMFLKYSMTWKEFLRGVLCNCS